MIKLTEYIRWRLMRSYYEDLIKPNSKIVDIGAGSLYISKLMQDYFKSHVTGVDVIDFRTAYVKKVIIKDNKLPFKDNSFDYATFNCVLHHIDFENQAEILKEAKRVAKEIIIFEDKKNLASCIWDKVFCPKDMHVPFAYRYAKDWMQFFKKLNFRPYYYEVKRPLYYPLKHLLFVLK